MASIFLEEIDQGVLVLLTEARQTHVRLPLFQVDWPGACDALLAPLHVDAPDCPTFLGRRSHFRDGGSPVLSALSGARQKTETKPDGSRRVTKTKSTFVIGSPVNLRPDWSGFTVRIYASWASTNKDEFKHAPNHCSRWRFSAFHVTILLVLHKHLSFCCDFDRLRLSERSEVLHKKL